MQKGHEEPPTPVASKANHFAPTHSMPPSNKKKVKPQRISPARRSLRSEGSETTIRVYMMIYKLARR